MTNPLHWWEGLGRPLTRLPRWGAIAALLVLIATMAWSVSAVAPVDQAETERVEASEGASQDASQGASQGDIALYARISQRFAAGENYYAVAMEEQRAGNYPTRPFVSVRLPTLAWLHSVIGVDGVRLASLLLLLGCLWGLHMRLVGHVAMAERVGALTMLALGGAAIAAPLAGLLHEVLAGMLLSFAFFFYSKYRFWPSLLAVGMALALRELAVHFVVLWLAFALAGKRWREVGALVMLLLLFIIGIYAHYLSVEALREAGDPASQGWDAMMGLSLPLMALSRLTALLALPVMIAAPLAILPLLGWLGHGGRMGLFAALWFIGFFAAMALFARPENFYWAQLALPAYFAGLAFAPRAILDLLRSAGARKERQI